MLKSISTLFKKLATAEVKSVKSIKAPNYHPFRSAEIAELERLSKIDLENEATEPKSELSDSSIKSKPNWRK